MTFLLVWSLRAAATILVGLLLSLALWRRSAATRGLVLRLTLAVALALPLVAGFVPRVEVPLPPPLPPSGSPRGKGPGDGGLAAPAPLPPLGVDLSDLPTVVYREPYSTRAFPVGLLLVPVYLLGVGVLALRWLVLFARLRRLARKGTPLEDGVRRAAIPVPATYGRTILLPLESEAWPEARVRAAILHERAHVRRRDWHWQTLAAGFAAIHWPNPLAWLLVRLLRDAAEAAADDEVLAQMRPSDYARELLAVAANAQNVGPALGMARRGGVKDRIAFVLTKRDRRAPSRRAFAGLLVALALVGLGTAGVTLARKGKVALRAVSDASGRRWDMEGRLLSPTKVSDPSNSFPPKAGERWVNLEFDLGDSPATHGLTMEADPPARVNGYGGIDTEGKPVWLSIVAPKALRTTNVRVGLAEGPWQEIPGSGSFKRTVQRVIGGNTPQYILGVDFPTRYRDEQVRIVARLRDGTEPKAIGTGSGHEDAFIRMHGSPEATLQIDGLPGDLASVVLQHRPYVWTTLRDVPLRPREAASSDKSDEAEQKPNGDSLQLVAIRERTLQGVRTWTPDGTENPPLPDGLGDLPQLLSIDASKGRRFQFILLAEGDPKERPDFRLTGNHGLAVSLVGAFPPTERRKGTVYAIDAVVPKSTQGTIDIDASYTDGESVPIDVPKSRWTTMRTILLANPSPAESTMVQATIPVIQGVDATDVRFVGYDAKGRVVSGPSTANIGEETTFDDLIALPSEKQPNKAFHGKAEFFGSFGTTKKIVRVAYTIRHRVHRAFRKVPLAPTG